MASEVPDIPPNMRRLYRRFERWRSAHTGHWPIPERLWAAATELARQHGVSPAASALRLDYGRLRQRVEAAGSALKGRVAKAPSGLRQTQGITRRRTAVPRSPRLRPRPLAFMKLLAEV